jgi:hypothetical protein
MGLIDLKTDLKSLKYGNDRFGGGSSNQPYIKKDIPDNLPPSSPDFLLRNGFLNPLSSANDVVRLSKYFVDLKSPSGLLFIAKQEMLSRSGVRTAASNGLFNEGAYNPLNTLLQAGLVSTGGHLNKQGLNPFAGLGSLGTLGSIGGVPNYGDYVQRPGVLSYTPIEVLHGGFFQQKVTNSSGAPRNIIDPTIKTYPGGPGSILGIGKTNITFATKNDGSILRTGLDEGTTSQTPASSGATLTLIQNTTSNSPLKLALGVTTLYSNTFGTGSINSPLDPNGTNTNTQARSTYQPGSTLKSDLTTLQQQQTYTWTSEMIAASGSSSYKQGATVYTDFRKTLRGVLKNIPSSSMASAQAPDYTTQNIENRVLLGDPGGRGRNLSSYVAGSGKGPLDRINALDLYRSEWVTDDPKLKNDLVKFRIAAIDNNNPSYKVFMHFRAFLDSFTDTYDAKWRPTKYLGRGENFYTYDEFSRGISMGWTVYAQSKEELIPMYRKLNYLASNLAPDYSEAGYMRGPLVQFTVGGYLYEQPGFITNLTYEVTQDSTWEIGIGLDTNTEGFVQNDTSVKELPHMIKVTCQFTPIQESVPKKQTLDFDPDRNPKYNNKDGTLNEGVPVGVSPDDARWVQYGFPRFIALSNVGHAPTTDPTTQNVEVDKKIISRKYSNYNSKNTSV